jgi:hypothetical protein
MIAATHVIQELILVSRAKDQGGGICVREVGCKVRLNSGGPEMLVVDFSDQIVTVAFGITGITET